MAPLASFVKFRVYFEAGSDPAHASTAAQFTEDVNLLATPDWGHYCQNIFEMKDGTGTFAARERGMFGIHYVNLTSGAIDTTWTSADFAAVESAIGTLFTGYGGASTDYRLTEHRWYRFGPGITKPNPPVRITTRGTPVVGVGTALIPHQNACSVTLRTALRKHWGRFYLPWSKLSDGNGGQLFSTTVDAIATAARTALTTPETSNGVIPVVWDRNRSRAYGMTELEVDSVTDIVRRRRARTPTYRKVFTS